MAYSKTPEQSTYQTQRIDFMGNPNQRDGTTKTKDQRMVNFYAERVKDYSGQRHRQYVIRTRPGVVYQASGGANASGRGITYFNGSLFTVIANKVYRNGVDMGVTLGNSSGLVGFTQFNGTFTALVLLDGIKGWVIKTDNTITNISDADFPTPHVPDPVYIDGYLFVAKSGTDDIYNCDLEDPFGWTPGSFITAELYPDAIVALAKNNNYLYAVGEKTIEFFYDAGIATGSPLQRNDSAVQQMGTPATNSVVQTDKEVIFIGSTDDSGGFTIWSITGFSPKEIAIPYIREALDAEGTNIANAYAYSFRVVGHKFYILNLTSRTLVYDFDEETWHEWTFTDDVTRYPFTSSSDHPDGAPRLIHDTNGNVVAMTDTAVLDQVTSGAGIPILCVMTTDKLDFDTNNRKTMVRLSMVSNAPQTANTPINIQWSDDDYQTFSSVRTMQMNGYMSAITQLGQFRRRAFKFTYNQPFPLLLENYEVDINIGGA